MPCSTNCVTVTAVMVFKMLAVLRKCVRWHGDVDFLVHHSVPLREQELSVAADREGGAGNCVSTDDRRHHLVKWRDVGRAVRPEAGQWRTAARVEMVRKVLPVM